LSPVSVEDFNKFREERIRDTVTNIIKGALTVVGVVASAAAIFVTGGTLLIALGAIAGGTLAAANAIDENKDPNTGEVNWMNVGISAGVGALFGGISAGMGKWVSGPMSKMFTGPANGTGKLMASTPARVWQATKVRMTVEGAKSGVSSAIDGTKDAVLSVLTGGKHKYSPQEHAFKVASGMAFGGLNSMISPVSGSLSKTKVSQLASKYIPGVSEKGIRKSISVSADTVSSMGQSAFESWGTGKEVRVEDLVWKGVTTATKKSKDYAKNAPTGDVGAPSTLKQMGTRPYTYGTYLNSKSRTKSFQKYFDQEAQKSVTNHVNKKYHLKDAYDIYKSRPGFLVWNDKDLKAESSVAEKGKGE
jgi:RHS-family protein